MGRHLDDDRWIQMHLTVRDMREGLANMPNYHPTRRAEHPHFAVVVVRRRDAAPPVDHADAVNREAGHDARPRRDLRGIVTRPGAAADDAELLAVEAHRGAALRWALKASGHVHRRQRNGTVCLVVE